MEHPATTNAFAAELETARVRLGLPTTATAWQIMCANAEREQAAKTFVDSGFGFLLGVHSR